MSREATDAEVAAVVASANSIAEDHRQVLKLVEREAWWTKRRPEPEAERLRRLSETGGCGETPSGHRGWSESKWNNVLPYATCRRRSCIG
ncbi:MAG: hypothetical protein R3C56_32055 [Pirellulaceae bacterium]